MSDSATPPAVRDDPEHSRFVLEQDGNEAELVYIRHPGQLILAHTEVPDALGGRGIGGRLVRAAIERAAAEGLTVVPWCPFARRWLREHDDVAQTVTMDWKTPPPSLS
jgi:predicted GNAT family acetyltransferase